MKHTRKNLFASLSALLIAVGSSHAATILFDDFEAGTNVFTTDPTTGGYTTTPNVTAAQSDGNTSGSTNSSIWVRATNGYGAGRAGTVDEAHGDFTDPTGEQAYAFRYTNSGITTVAGLFGTLGSFTVGQTITVSFDVVLDGHNTGRPFNAGLVTFTTGAVRTDMSGSGMDMNTSAVLATLNDPGNGTGTTGITVGTTYQRVSFSYTPTGLEATSGDDLALRFDGATSTAIFDNVQVSVIPEPTAALLGGIGFLLLLRRRRA